MFTLLTYDKLKNFFILYNLPYYIIFVSFIFALPKHYFLIQFLKNFFSKLIQIDFYFLDYFLDTICKYFFCFCFFIYLCLLLKL